MGENTKKKKYSNTFCPAPFNSVAVLASGRWALCCESKADYTHPGGHRHIGDTPTLGQWFEGDYMNAVRASMLAGEPLKECAWCYKTEAQGGHSLRQRFLQDGTYAVGHDTANPGVRYLDIKFGNKCNLKCKMCFPHSSSELVEEWRALGWDLEDPMEGERKEYYAGYMEADYNWPRHRENIDKLLSVSQTTKLIKFTGGEPMLNPQMFTFLSHCVERGVAQDIELQVITNCTKIHPRFRDLAGKFKRLHLVMSMDGMGGTYEYIRYPANWSEVEANALTYRSWYREGLVRGNLTINTVLNVFNLHQICELTRNGHRFTGRSEGVYTYDMDHPGFMSWRHAPEDTQQRALRDAVRLSYDRDRGLAHRGRELCELLKRHNQVPDDASRQRLREFVTQQDRLRGIDIADYIPHLQGTMRAD